MSEPFPTLAEERGIAVRPLSRPADAKATPITALFWNKEWAAKNPELAQTVMTAYLKAAAISRWTTAGSSRVTSR